VVVAAVGAGSALAKSSLMDIRSSSSSLEMMSGEVPPRRSDLSVPAVALMVYFFHLGVPQQGHRVGWISSGLLLPLTVASIIANFEWRVILQRHSVLDTELILPGAPQLWCRVLGV
jgi:hypothetical protein